MCLCVCACLPNFLWLVVLVVAVAAVVVVVRFVLLLCLFEFQLGFCLSASCTTHTHTHMSDAPCTMPCPFVLPFCSLKKRTSHRQTSKLYSHQPLFPAAPTVANASRFPSILTRTNKHTSKARWRTNSGFPRCSPALPTVQPPSVVT